MRGQEDRFYIHVRLPVLYLFRHVSRVARLAVADAVDQTVNATTLPHARFHKGLHALARCCVSLHDGECDAMDFGADDGLRDLCD